jgi:hypothetical protein
MLLMHCGGEHVDLNQLKEIPLPDETASYKPVAHYDLALNLAEVASGLLHEHTLEKSQYGIARDGRQLFGVHTFKSDNDSMGLSIGFRNSYDKSMSVGIAVGASVFVCDNLALTGEVTVMRKHTTNVWHDLEEMAITTIYRSKSNFHRILEDAEDMKYEPVDDDLAYRQLGLLYGRGVVTPRQIPVVKKEWLEPSYPDFEPRNQWSFYNAVTEALKSTPPTKIMEKHLELHSIMMKGE